MNSALIADGLVKQFSWYAVSLPVGSYTLGAVVTDSQNGLTASYRLASPTVVQNAWCYTVNSTADVVAADGVVTLREAIAASSEAILRVALRPDLTEEELARRIEGRDPKQSFSTFARKSLKLSPAAIGLLQECAKNSSQPIAQMTAAELADLVNAAPVRLTGVAALARAISTAGGVVFDEIDATFMLTRRPGVFVAGEMLDWEAPTGGYLLQASFATGAAAGRGALDWIARGGGAPESRVSGT